MRMPTVGWLVTVALTLTLGAVGCGSSGKGGDDTVDPDATLTISPPTQTLTITDPTMPVTQAYTATLKNPDGTTEDVTAKTVFSTGSAPGAFDGPTLTTSFAGKVGISGTYMGKSGNAELVVNIMTTRIDPAVPPNAPDLFTGAVETPAQAPTVVYPAVGVIVPRNLGDFDVHWTDSSPNDVYEVSLTTEFSDIRAYVPATSLSANPATTPTTAWMEFLSDEWLNAVGTSTTVTFQVRGVQSTAPGTVGSAPPQTVLLTNEEMLGGLYYWATESTTMTGATGVYGIFRHDMSLPGQPAMQYLTSMQSPAGHACVACHVLSRDGKEMAVTFDGGDGISTLVDVATSALQTPANHWNFATFTPDGTELVAIEDGVMTVRKYADQSILATLNAGPSNTHPDLSPDGTKLVFVQKTGGSDYSFFSGQIFIASFDQTTNTLGAPTLLVGDTYNNYYPTFSPDGNWVLYTRSSESTMLSPSGSYNSPDAELCVISTAPGSTPIVLATANTATAGLTNSWGRWAPFSQTFGTNNEMMFWLTVSSKRDFGVRLINSTQTTANQVPQLWMTPFFPDRATAGMDPSAPAFRLPFQDLNSRNHIAQWTQSIVTVQ